MNERQLAGIFVLLAGQWLFTAQCWAETWQDGVSVGVSTEYETNPAMSPTNPGSVWRAVLSPSYALMGVFGKSSINAGLAAQIARASNKTLSPDRDNPSAYLNWSNLSEVGMFGISTRYSQMATRDTGGVDATGSVPVNSTSTTRTLSGSWSKDLSERSSLSADGAYEGVSYKGGGIYNDYSTRSGGVRYSYIWNEQVSSFCRVSGNRYLPTNGEPTSSRVDTMIGVDWKTEYLDWAMQIGKSRVSGGNSDTQGSISARYTGQRNLLKFDAGRSVSSSGLGGYSKTEHVNWSWNYALSEYSNTGIDLERRKNHSSALTTAGTSTSSRVWLDSSLTELWRMRTYYSHRINDGGELGSASSDLIGFSFTYSTIDF